VAIKSMRNSDAFAFEVDFVDIAAEKVDMPDHFANRINDVGQIQIAGRDLVQHRCKQKEVFPVNNRHLETRVFASFKVEDGVKAAESAPENEHTSFGYC